MGQLNQLSASNASEAVRAECLRPEILHQRTILFEAARAALSLSPCGSAHLHYLDLVRDVLLIKGGLRADLFSSKEEAFALCQNQIEHLVTLRKTSPIPLALPHSHIDLARSTIGPVDRAIANELLFRLHYLHSPRPQSLNLGLYAKGATIGETLLIGVVSVDACDSERVVSLLNMPAHLVRMLSRSIVLQGAPKNSASRLIGQAMRWLRKFAPDVAAIATYNNPNLAFSGAIYKATNWTLIGHEEKQPDLLLDGKYITLRELKRRYGTFRADKLIDNLGTRVVVQPPPCFPLEIYAYSLK